jgi:hypothetical protein
MVPQYRKDYPGEFVILETKWANGRKEQKREWIENPIQNQHISGRAACIGSDIDLDQFDYSLLENHRGGLLGGKKLQTYGVSKITAITTLNFAVELQYENIQQLVESGYTENNIVYTTARNCIKHPGLFYLIPRNPQLSTIALPLYLAAFDGHDEVFMLGYNNDTVGDRSDWVQQVTEVITLYSSTIFTMVGSSQNMPKEWMSCSNTRNFSYRDFVTYCDV